VTKDTFCRWYDDIDLCKYVYAQAKRHANNDEDMADFIQEAWMRVSQLPDNAKIPRIQGEVYRGIHAAYERGLRRRKREIPFSRLGSRAHVL